MAEDFPSYRQEDDDDAPVSEGADRQAAPAPPAAESHSAAPVGQEGTIFSRDTIAPNLSRPLFDFIRKQEQPDAKMETVEDMLQKPELPSVSVPGEPEMRTYQPPAEAELPQQLHEAAVAEAAAHAAELDDDDDTEDEEDHHTTHAQPVAPPPRPAPTPQPPAESRPQSLNEQFEEIMRAEMGEDYTRLASGDRLGDTAVDTAAATEPRPRTETEQFEEIISTEMDDDFARHTSGDRLDDTDVTATEPSPVEPGNPSSPNVFYYNGSVTPPPYNRGGGGNGNGGNGGGFNYNNGSGSNGMPSYNMNVAPPLGPMASEAVPLPVARREKSHNGRWFAAGVLTGWVLKQHFANKKMRAVQAEHAKATESQNEQIGNLQYTQHHTEQRLQTAERQVQAQQAEQVKQQQTAQRAEAIRQNQEQAERYRQAAAERVATRQADHEAARAAAAPSVLEQAATVAAPPAAEQLRAAPAAPAEQPLQQQRQQEWSPLPPLQTTMETPLQYAPSGGAEIPFAAAAAGSAMEARPAAERPAAPFGPEAAAAEAAAAKARAELQPQAAREAAQELVEKAYTLQAGQHVEHAAGAGHNIIVDNHGHEVQNAIEYGEEFHSQRRRNQLRAGILASDGRATKSTSSSAAAAQSYSTGGIVTGTGLSSGQVPMSHDLPSGPLLSSKRKRLAAGKRDNPVVATVASPWLWASVIVLLLAFFIAAFV